MKDIILHTQPIADITKKGSFINTSANQLEITLSYTKGSWNTKRGYYLEVNHVEIGLKMKRFVLGGSASRLVKEASRFSAATMKKLAEIDLTTQKIQTFLQEYIEEKGISLATDEEKAA